MILAVTMLTSLMIAMAMMSIEMATVVMVYVMEHVVDDDGGDVGDGGDDGDDDDDSDTRFIHNNPITSTQHEHKAHHECNELPGLYLPGVLATWFVFTRCDGYLVCMCLLYGGHERSELPGLYLPGLLATWFSFTRLAGYLVCMHMAISLFIVSRPRPAAISAQDTSIGNP